MNRIVKWVIAANLLVLAALALVYPHLMVGPGKLIPGHAKLDSDCFACHTMFTGADSSRCINCHKPQEIGRFTTVGLPVVKPLTSTPFHQKLISSDCIACHSDHSGVKRFRTTGSFNHQLLEKTTLAECQSCHQSPKDTLHQKITGNCSQCHTQDKWVPATFDHRDYFELDRDHNVKCVTCHIRNDYSQYTCYGCHEHTPQNIRKEHIEEGIRNFDNCVECHRNADEHDIRGPGREGRSDNRSNRRREKEHDD